MLEGEGRAIRPVCLIYNQLLQHSLTQPCPTAAGLPMHKYRIVSPPKISAIWRCSKNPRFTGSPILRSRSASNMQRRRTSTIALSENAFAFRLKTTVHQIFVVLWSVMWYAVKTITWETVTICYVTNKFPESWISTSSLTHSSVGRL